jgi:hypothetical protein
MPDYLAPRVPASGQSTSMPPSSLLSFPVASCRAFAQFHGTSAPGNPRQGLRRAGACNLLLGYLFMSRFSRVFYPIDSGVQLIHFTCHGYGRFMSFT